MAEYVVIFTGEMLTVNGWIGIGIGIFVAITAVILFLSWYFGSSGYHQSSATMRMASPVGYDLQLTRKKNARKIMPKLKKGMAIAVKESQLAKSFNRLINGRS